MEFLGSWRKGFTVLSAEGKNLQFWVLKKGRDSQCWVLKEGRILVVLGAEGRDLQFWVLKDWRWSSDKMRQKSIHLIMRRLWTQATARAAAGTTKVGVLVAQEPRPSTKLLASRFCVSPCFLWSKIHSWQQQQIMSERERERLISFTL